MPRLKLHGWSLNVASDDFVFSGSLEILLRTFGLLGLWLLCVRYGRVEPGLDCYSSHVVTNYLYGLAALFCITVLTDVQLVLVSMRGTIVDDAPRKHIPALLQARVVVQVVELVWNIIGSVWVLQRVSGCGDHAHWVVYRVVVGTWVMAAISLLLVVLWCDLRRDHHQAVITKHDWEQRWRCLCCCLSGGGENDAVFSTLAHMCGQLFKKEELVGSDILAGLMLVYHRQRHTRQGLDVVDAANIAGRLRPRSRSSPTEPRGWMTFQQMAHYMKFALGSYGWPYFIGLNNPIVASCQLIPRLRLRSYSQVHKDNVFCANTTAFLIQTGVTMDDVISATYHNEVYSIPFYVSFDRETQSIVVSIRGTLSVEDILTDLVVERAEIDVPGVEGGYVHKGMLQSALYIKRQLEQTDMLNEAFKKYSVSGLVITGHSLGAGVAALLAILLRPTHPDVVCYAFAPPGELISENLIPYTKSFICSVALGYDVVPRLGLLELKKLKINILTAIQRCKLPKHQLIASGIWQKIFGEHLHDEALLDCDRSPDSDPHGRTDWLQSLLEEEIQEQESLLASYLPLLPPGQILHVLEEVPTDRSRRPKQYYAEWTDARTFQEIILSRRMIAHHFPDTLLGALTQIASPDEVIHAESKKSS